MARERPDAGLGALGLGVGRLDVLWEALEAVHDRDGDVLGAGLRRAFRSLARTVVPSLARNHRPKTSPLPSGRMAEARFFGPCSPPANVDPDRVHEDDRIAWAPATGFPKPSPLPSPRRRLRRTASIPWIASIWPWLFAGRHAARVQADDPGIDLREAPPILGELVFEGVV